MNVVRMLAAGLAGGLLGTALWAGVGIATGGEAGWMALGVGALAGLGVRLFGARQTSHFDRKLKRMVRERSAPAGRVAGAVAALAAVAAALAGKVLVVHLLTSASASSTAAAPAASSREDAEEETMIAYVANDVAREAQAEGRELTWPPGVAPFEAFGPEEFPPEIWAAARSRWEALAEADKEAYAEQKGEHWGGALSSVASGQLGGVLRSFGLFDLLWFGLAFATAFKIGASAGE